MPCVAYRSSREMCNVVCGVWCDVVWYNNVCLTLCVCKGMVENKIRVLRTYCVVFLQSGVGFRRFYGVLRLASRIRDQSLAL